MASVDLDTYINDHVEIELKPALSQAREHNLDEGEIHNFDISIRNNGPIAIIIATLRLDAINTYGVISMGWNGSQWGMVVGGNWTNSPMDIPLPDLPILPGASYIVPHGNGAPHTFGYRADTWTGTSTDEYRKVNLISAQVIEWRPVVNAKSKSFYYNNNIQRD